MFLPLVLRSLPRIGIFATLAIVSVGYFFTGLRNAQIDCNEGSTHNTGACIVDYVEAITAAVVTVAASGAAVADIGGLIPRDHPGDDDFDLAHVDGLQIHKWEVFNRAWMKENLREHERKYIVINTTRAHPTGGKLMTEAWLEDGYTKLSQYAVPQPGHQKRTTDVYLHYSAETSNIKFEFPKIQSSYADELAAAQIIFDDLANRHADSNCYGFEFHPSGGSFESAWLGIQGSNSPDNQAPLCLDPESDGQGKYEQIGDMSITGY